MGKKLPALTYLYALMYVIHYIYIFHKFNIKMKQQAIAIFQLLL